MLIYAVARIGRCEWLKRLAVECAAVGVRGAFMRMLNGPLESGVSTVSAFKDLYRNNQ